MFSVPSALSTCVPSVERRSFLSPPAMSLSDFGEAHPPIPTPTLAAGYEFATTQTQCRLFRDQRQLKPGNRDCPEYLTLIDGGTNFQFKLLPLRDAQRRYSIVHHIRYGFGPESDLNLDLVTARS